MASAVWRRVVCVRRHFGKLDVDSLAWCRTGPLVWRDDFLAIHPKSCILTVEQHAHQPLPQREWSDKEKVFNTSNNFPAFFFEWVVEQISQCRASNPGERLRWLSSAFSDLAASPPETLIAIHQAAVLRDTSERLQHMGTLLASGKGSDAWQKYLREGIAELSTTMDTASVDGFVVSGSPNTLSGSELISFWQETWVEAHSTNYRWPVLIRK